MRSIALATFLLLFWLVLSGHYTLWLVGAGIVSAIVLMLFAKRAGSVDEEGVPLAWFPGLFTYWPWLFWEIIKSTYNVALIIINPKLPISPTLIRVPVSQRTPVGITVYANSITLTPGTISAAVSARDRRILVHALTEAGAKDTAEGSMDRHITEFEGKLL